MSLFITGTGTGVGKTVVTAGLADALHRQGQPVCVLKPIQTGSPAEQPEDPHRIQQWLKGRVTTACTYSFPQPAAPYVADPGRTIDPVHLVSEFQRLRRQYPALLVEGAGGVRVPVAPRFEMLDLMKRYGLPVLVVASPFLGTFNHTLLTVDALLQAGLEVKGVVVSGMPPAGTPGAEDFAVKTLPEMLEAFLPVPLLGLLPEFPVAAASFEDPTVQRHFDALLKALSLPIPYVNPIG
jgi:dethiobiotin synthetase